MKLRFRNLFLLGLFCIGFHINDIFFLQAFTIEMSGSGYQQNVISCRDSIPVYPGSAEQSQMEKELEEFIKSMEMMSGISDGEVSAYTTKDQPGEVVQFYLNHPPEGGWERTVNLTSREEGGIIIWKKENDSAQLFIAEKGGKTFILLGCSSQTDATIITNIMTFSEEDGLADRSVVDIAVTPDGIAWISTRSGLSRFDGTSWATYQKKDGLPADLLTAVELDQNNLPWIGTDFRGCASFDGESWHRYEEVAKVSTITIASNGDVWLGSCDVSRGGVYHFNGQDWIWHKKKDGVGDTCVRALAIGTDGIVWAATKNGLSRFDGNAWVNYTEENGLVNNEVNDVAVDQDGRVWSATDQGISCFDGNTWCTYTTEDGLVNSKVTVIEVAPDDSVWFGTEGGISHLREGIWQNYTEKDGLPSNRILSLCAAHDGKIWIGTPFDGLSILNP